MKLFEIKLFEGFSDEELIRIAREVGEELFAHGRAGQSGFMFPKNPKVHRGPLPADFKSYGTMQSPFKPSKKMGQDRSDSAIRQKDVDVDGKLYVMDAEDGIYVYTPKGEIVLNHPEAEEMKQLGFNLHYDWGQFREWGNYKYNPGSGLKPGEISVMIGDEDNMIEVGTEGRIKRENYDSPAELIAALKKKLSER